MTFSFLIPLAIAVVTSLVAYQSREEIVKTFSIIIMIITLLLSFVWAPWFVQVVILAGSLGGIRYFCDRHSCHNPKKID